MLFSRCKPKYCLFSVVLDGHHVLVQIVLVLCVCGIVQGQATINLVQTSYVVKEGDQFIVRIVKTGTAATFVNVAVQVKKFTRIDNIICD